MRGCVAILQLCFAYNELSLTCYYCELSGGSRLGLVDGSEREARLLRHQVSGCDRWSFSVSSIPCSGPATTGPRSCCIFPGCYVSVQTVPSARDCRWRTLVWCRTHHGYALWGYFRTVSDNHRWRAKWHQGISSWTIYPQHTGRTSVVRG